MKLLWSVIFAVFAVAHFGFVFSGRISSCPRQCVCEDDLCRINRRRGRLVCRGVAVNCYEQNLTAVPEGIPSNATGILLSNNALKFVDLNDFASLNRLTGLFVDNNNASKLLVGKPLKRLLKLSLKNNLISFLPSRDLLVLKALSELYLQNNQIRDIREIRFPVRLNHLNLNDNYLTELSAGSFRKMKKLRVLKINNNKIESINPQAFLHLKGLEVLELAGNLIEVVPPNAFEHLSGGFYLNLKNNRLNELHPYSFRLFGSQNEHHHQIRLDHNRLQFLTSELFDILLSRKNSYSLYFAGNPVFCDCNLQTFRDAAGGMIVDKRRIFCHSPNEYVDTSVEDLNIEDCCF